MSERHRLKLKSQSQLQSSQPPLSVLPLPPLPLPLPPPPVQSNHHRVNDEIEQLFKSLRQEIGEYQTLAQSINSFKQYIEHGLNDGIFDQEDLEWINSDLSDIIQRKEQKEQELIQKEDLYRNSVLKLEEILDKRTEAIEQAEQTTHALSLRPNLLQNFAKKRAHLMMLVDKGKKDLQTYHN
jgi:DNA repair exonuclease SbcCD ATPase subunit